MGNVTAFAARTFRLPDTTQRHAVVGRTGSGKTQFGAWGLSKAHWDKIPYVIIDYKRDELLNDITNVREISFNDKLAKNGLHIIHPRPDQDEEVEAFLMKLWERENVGIFADEGYMLPDKGALRAILTQGRSKHIPVTILSQRPVFMSRFVFTEADFFTIFHLNHEDDDRTVRKYFAKKEKGRLAGDLPEFHSKYYDVGRDTLFHLLPVPNRETILQDFSDRTRASNLRLVKFV